MRLVTNFHNCPSHLTLPDGRRVDIVAVRDWMGLRAELGSADLVVVDCSSAIIYRVCAYFAWRFWRKTCLVAVDMVCRHPKRLSQRLTAPLKRLLFRRVDHFVHYFKDWRTYEAEFGIPAAKSSYVPFKSNITGVDRAQLEITEDYVFTMGVSMRDYDTFIKAIAGLSIPVAIPEYSLAHFETRTADFPWHAGNLPPNLKVLRDTGNRDDMIRNLARAKLVVVPTLRDSPCASGISTYMDSMYLGKCVIISEGPGASDVLTDQAVLVPAENVEALRAAIIRMWDDDHTRARVARIGHEYVTGLGGEPALLERVFTASLDACVAKARRA